MKTSWLIIALLAFTVKVVQGQDSQPAASTSQGTIQAQDTSYAVVDRGANHRVWQKTTYETTADGQQIPHIHKYTELTTGLHYQKNGQWVESKEEIEILPNGTAAATHGQHQTYFPGNIAQGVIEVVTPDDKHLRSRPLGLSYDDGTKTVLIAELKDSVGQLVGANQVIYPDAFTDFKADLRYTYTKSGFEQDIILREQPLTPESYGLNPATARLQVLTEFFNPPQPKTTPMTMPKQAGISMADENLDFGAAKMMPGRAFLLGSDAHEEGVRVGKSWVKLEGRQFLVEEVPVEALADVLATLPVTQEASIKAKTNTTQHMASRKLLLTTQHVTKSSPCGSFMQVAQNMPPSRGLVLDYQMMSGLLTNYTFQGDTTYYISGTLHLMQTNTFEGGAVLKYAVGASISVAPVSPGPVLRWLSTAYRPVIFTAKDDDSVGEIISGSTGNPTNYYANPTLYFPSIISAQTLSYIRIAYAKQAILTPSTSLTLSNAQFVNCQNGISVITSSLSLRNVLFSHVLTNFNNIIVARIDAQNVTFNNSAWLATTNVYVPVSNVFSMKNCIFANVTNLTMGNSSFTGGYNGFYNSREFGSSAVTNNFYPFQTVGAGNYYLASGCAFTNAGTTNIDSILLADLRRKTTYPPMVYSNMTIYTNITLAPHAQRDTNAAPDFGYHYDPLDYMVSEMTLYNKLFLTNGVSVGLFGSNAFNLSGGQVFSTGTPQNPNCLAAYLMVQEQPMTWDNPLTLIFDGGNFSPIRNVQARFTDISVLRGGSAGPCYLAPGYGPATPYPFIWFQFQDCWLRGVSWTVAPSSSTLFSTTIILWNNLFERDALYFVGVGQSPGPPSAPPISMTFSLQNNLFYGGSLSFDYISGNYNWDFPTCPVYDNAFDNVALSESGDLTSVIQNGNNGYINSPQLSGGSSNLVLTAFNYASGPLGNYYQWFTNFIDQGNCSADQVGLYHYTTQTNQVKETNSMVDIGYHYVALDASGNSIDSNGNGIPDYLEDANGNGMLDTGEINWGLAILTQPTNQTVIQGSNATFRVTAAGVVPLTFQWYFNSSALTNQTNALLTLNDVQTSDVGSYYVVIINSLGPVTSSNAMLAVLVPPAITIQPANQTVIVGTNVTFTVTATGTIPLGYQWYFNGTNLLAGATNTSLIVANVQTTNAGNYSVVVTNVAGGAASSNAALTVWVAVPMLAVGGERIMELTTNGDVISWGGNQYGELGDYTSLDSTNPVHVVGLTNIVKIASGLNHSLAIDANGALWAWGDNQYGQLGDNDYNYVATNQPVPVSGMSNSVVDVAGGQMVSIAEMADGTVWTWGREYCGSGSANNIIPRQVEGLTNVIAIAAGIQHFMALSSDGTLWAWGVNDYGQLGDGITSDGGTSPTQVLGLSNNIVAICAGYNHSLALDTNGCVWVWGLNESGQIGDGEITNSAILLPVMVFSNAVQIAAGANHSLALDNQSNVWAWGANGAGQLGANSFSMTNLPVQIAGLTNIIAIAAGSDASAALDDNGSMWQWGASYSDGANWMWGDESGAPALAPQYVDFYNGQLPNLTVLNGNDQICHTGWEFQQPLVFQVTDLNGTPLSNAPVSVEAVVDEMELRTADGNYCKGLRLTTDTNGEVYLIGYAQQNLVTSVVKSEPLNANSIESSDQTTTDSTCLFRVLAASRERVAETNINGTLLPLPTVSITSPADGSTVLIGTNQSLTITVDAEAASGASIQEVDYYFHIYGEDQVLLGVSTENPFVFTWTNAFVGQLILSAMALDNGGGWSDPGSVTVNIVLDSDGNGLPDYWQLQYFGHWGIDPNADPDGDGLSNLQEYQAGTNPTDYYNGNLPGLEIISGNNQGGYYGSFLCFPVIVGVTDTNSVAMTNAPVTFTVANGSALLASMQRDVTNNTISLRTDTNGQASVWVYILPASTNSSNSAILISASNDVGVATVTANECAMIGHWTFNDTNNWVDYEGQLPLLTNNLAGVPSWGKNGAWFNNTNSSLLAYSVWDTNRSRCINFQQGSIQFWFKPDWSSSNCGGCGPGNSGRLIETGDFTSIPTNGWWSLYFNPDGTKLLLGTSTNGGLFTNLCANTSWHSSQWRQILLTYSPTSSDLYLDGQWVTNGTGVRYYPGVDTNSFRIGSDQDGYNQPEGTFEELKAFNGILCGTIPCGSLPLAPPTISLLVTNQECQVILEQDRANDIISSVTGEIYPNIISFTVANNYAGSLFAERPDYLDNDGQGINIAALQSPVITPSGGLIIVPTNITISFSDENLTNLATGLYQTELSRNGNSDEIQTIVDLAQELRNQGNSDEQIRSNLINGTYFRNSAEYIFKHGVAGDVYEANTNYTIEYSLNNGSNWITYTAPIQVASSVLLQAKVKKAGSSDNRTHYAYLDSDISTAQFFYIPPSWMEQYFGPDYSSNTNAGPDADPDHDGLSNLQEYQLGTDPTIADADGDGINDAAEVAAGSDPISAASVPNRRLGYWRFDTMEWLGEEGQAPLSFTNLSSIANWSTYALSVDNTNPAYLVYRIVETNGQANIMAWNGSIRFWFEANWNSSTTNNGSGPGSLARLIEMGSQDSTDGWWTLVSSADGTMLNFITQTNGIGLTNLSATINWTSNDWHQVTLVYSSTNSLLYLDGQLAANGVGVTYYPAVSARANGFCVGSDHQGNNQAQGLFDELETFNYLLSASSILENYNLLTPGGSGPIDYIEYLEGRNPLVYGAAIPDTNGIVNLIIYTPMQ